MNEIIQNPKRILIKLSGEALQGEYDYGIDPKMLDYVAEKVVHLSKEKGIQIVVVIGGGNIFRGIQQAQEGINRATGDYMGMIATVMNGVALGDAVSKAGNTSRIVSALEVPKVAESFIRNKVLKHLRKNRVVVSVGGTGNPYFTTDSAAILRALELSCDFMVKGTKVDGVYDSDPHTNDYAKRYDTISLTEAFQKGLKVMDQSAIGLANDENLPVFVCKIDDIDKIGTNNINGTYVYIE